MNCNRPILIVEDDQVDIMFLERSINEVGIKNQLYFASDGEAALALLNDPDMISPCIILLDLNLPRMNGIEFLDEIKHDDLLKRIPVITLTSSNADQDKIDCYSRGVAGFMVKPVDYEKLVGIVKAIDDYWSLSELSPLG